MSQGYISPHQYEHVACGVMVTVDGNGHGDLNANRLLVFHIALIPLGKV